MSSVLVRAARRAAAPFTSAGRWYYETAQRSPFTTGVITTGLKTSAADAFAQLVVERKDELDLKRHAVFCVFGFSYLGCFQYYLYNVVFTKLCTPLKAVGGSALAVAVKVFLDQGLHHPFMYFPTFYLMKGTLDQKPVSETLSTYWNDMTDNCLALWKIWVPAQIVNFAFVPMHLRIPFAAGVSFVWTVILSLMRGAFTDEDAKDGDVVIMEHLEHVDESGDLSAGVHSEGAPAQSTAEVTAHAKSAAVEKLVGGPVSSVVKYD